MFYCRMPIYRLLVRASSIAFLPADHAWCQISRSNVALITSQVFYKVTSIKGAANAIAVNTYRHIIVSAKFARAIKFNRILCDIQISYILYVYYEFKFLYSLYHWKRVISFSIDSMFRYFKQITEANIYC